MACVPRGTAIRWPQILEEAEAEQSGWADLCEHETPDQLGINGAQRVSHHIDRIKRAKLEHFDRIAVDGGPMIETVNRRRPYIRSALGLIGLAIFIAGAAAVAYGAFGKTTLEKGSDRPLIKQPCYVENLGDRTNIVCPADVPEPEPQQKCVNVIRGTTVARECF